MYKIALTLPAIALAAHKSNKQEKIDMTGNYEFRPQKNCMRKIVDNGDGTAVVSGTSPKVIKRTKASKNQPRKNRFEAENGPKDVRRGSCFSWEGECLNATNNAKKDKRRDGSCFSWEGECLNATNKAKRSTQRDGSCFSWEGECLRATNKAKSPARCASADWQCWQRHPELWAQQNKAKAPVRCASADWQCWQKHPELWAEQNKAKAPVRCASADWQCWQKHPELWAQKNANRRQANGDMICVTKTGDCTNVDTSHLWAANEVKAPKKTRPNRFELPPAVIANASAGQTNGDMICITKTGDCTNIDNSHLYATNDAQEVDDTTSSSGSSSSDSEMGECDGQTDLQWVLPAKISVVDGTQQIRVATSTVGLDNDMKGVWNEAEQVIVWQDEHEWFKLAPKRHHRRQHHSSSMFLQ